MVPGLGRPLFPDREHIWGSFCGSAGIAFVDPVPIRDGFGSPHLAPSGFNPASTRNGSRCQHRCPSVHPRNDPSPRRRLLERQVLVSERGSKHSRADNREDPCPRDHINVRSQPPGRQTGTISQVTQTRPAHSGMLGKRRGHGDCERTGTGMVGRLEHLQILAAPIRNPIQNGGIGRKDTSKFFE